MTNETTETKDPATVDGSLLEAVVMPRMTPDEAMQMTPEMEKYECENDLIAEFCRRAGCNECYGTMPESDEPCGYGCALMENWTAKHGALVA